MAFDPTGAVPFEFDTKEAVPVRKVGAVEGALRTAAGATQSAVRAFDMAAAGLAGIFGDTEGQEQIFTEMKGRQERMTEAYAPKADEEIGFGSKLAGAALSIPAAMVGGPVAPGIERTSEVLERGGTMGQAVKAGATSATVNTVLMAVPAAAGLKAAQLAGMAGKGATRAVATGAATGAAINVPLSATGRAIENAALPEGEQFAELEQPALDPGALATDLVMSAGFGAAGGKHGHASGKKAAKVKADATFPADKMEDLGDGKYRTPNGVEITKEDWESNSQRVREGWLKPKPVEEKIPTGEAKELSPGEAAAALVDKPDTSAIDKVLEQHPTGPIAEAAKAAKAKKIKAAEAAAKKAKDQTDAADMRRAAATIEDPDLKAELLARAEKLDKTEKIPVGEVKEGQPDIPVKEEKIPVGKVTEGQPDIPVSNEKIPVGEVTAEYPAGGTPVLKEPASKTAEPIPAGEVRELYADPNREGGPIPKGEATEVEMLPVGEVREGQPDIPVTKEKIPVGEAAEMIPTGEATEIKKIPTGKVTEIPAERVKTVSEMEKQSTSEKALSLGSTEGDARLAQARANNTFTGQAPSAGSQVGYTQPRGTPVEKLFSNFADNPKASPEAQATFRQKMLERADADPKEFAKDPVETYKAAMPGGLTVTVDAAKHGTTRVRVTDASGKLMGAARIKKGLIDSIATAEGARGRGIGADILRFIDREKIGNIHEVPDRSPGFVKIQKKVIGEAGRASLDLGLPKIDEAFMREQERVAPRGAEARAAAAPDERGRRHVHAEIDRAVADGRLDKDEAALAKWALDQNPNLAAGLKLRVGGEAPVKGARGAYDDINRVVEVFKKGAKSVETLVHEVLHHAERLMPQKVQEGIRREWRRHIQAAIAKTKDPATKAALADIPRAMKGDVEARERVRDAVRAGKLDYHLYDPSEFWAVNAARILNERHGSRNAWHTQARQWLREMVEHIKSTIGLRSDAPVLKALDEVLNPKKTTGVDRSPTLIKKAAGADDDRSFAMGPTKRTLGDETRSELTERRLFDRFNRVAKLQKAEAPKTESADAYQADQLYHGRLQHRGDRLERDFIKPLGKALKAAKKAGITVRDADDYLMALHAPERNAAIAQRNPKMQDGGSGLTNQQAKDIVDGFTPEQRKHLDAIAKIVHDLNRTKLDTMVDDGLISAQTRDALNQQFKKYVPLKTLEAEDEFTGAGRGYAMRANDIVAALGRKTKASSPIAASVMDASRAAIRGEKARVERAIWEYAQNKDAHDFIKPYDPENPPPEVMDRKIGPDGKVKEIVDSGKVQKLTIPMVVNGEDVRVFVPDQLLRDQLMKITQTDPGPVLATIARGTSMIGRLLTEFNPSFTIPNAVKDAITVAVRAGAHDGVSTARVMANIPKAWKTIIEYKVGAKSSGAAEYEEFLKAGGKTGAYGIQGVADTMRALEKAGAELGYAEHKAGYARRVGRVLKLIPRAISGANEVLEYASRFAMYKEMRRTGASPAKSAAAAKEITVNFNRSGDWGRNLNSLLVFANAALQGLRNTVVYLKSPHVRKGVMGLVALGAAVQYWNEQMGGENEETGELNINSQHDAVADKNVVMLMPGQREGFKIPMPPEYAFPYLLGRRLYRAMSQGNTTKEVAGIAGGLIDTVLPVRLPEADSGALAVGRAVVPTLAAPVAEVWLNQSYFGTPIVPEQHGRTPVPYHTMSRATTSELAKSISEIANSVTGGDNVKPGLSQKMLGPLISPEGIEHLTKGYTGGVGATVMQAKNLVNNVSEDKPIDINKVPVVSRFAFQEPQSYTGRRYRELAEDYDQAVRYRKAGEWDKIAPRVQASLEQYEVAEKELRVLFKELREAGADGTDREQVQQRIKAVQSRVIKAYNQTGK